MWNITDSIFRFGGDLAKSVKRNKTCSSSRERTMILVGDFENRKKSGMLVTSIGGAEQSRV
jgi:hypothetical protein